MKFNNKLLILTVFLLAMISLSAVSAADDVDGLTDDSDALSVSQEADQLNADPTYNKTIYVDSQGDDSGAGTQQSPYASLNKAISSVDASDNAIINIGAGIYSGENNTDLKINLAHINYGGSLTIAGAGYGKTIIDANLESPIFTSISADSIVILKDIAFINGKANTGAAINSNGDLTIDNCLFEKNAAGAYGAVYQTTPNNFKVVNSVFRDNTAGSGNVNIYYSTYQDTDYVVEIINNTFSNATTSYSWADSSCVYVQASHILVQGNTFANISGTGKGSLNVRADDCNVTDNVFKDCSYDGSNDGGILYIGDAYIKGNTFENWTSTKGAAIYALLNFNANLAYDDKLVEETTFKLTCNVTDDMGNPVNTYGDVFFYFGDEKLGSAKANGGVATLSVSKLLDNGVYNLTGTYGYVSFGDVNNPFECTVKNATVTVDFDHNYMDVWVAADGNDTIGNGSEDNPFQTIKNAIDYAIDEDSVDFTIHVKDGLYNITGDYGLSYSDVVRFSIVGENYGKAIISANNAGFTFLTSGQYTDISLKNLTFVNSTTNRAFNVRYLTMEGCIVDNVGQLYAQSNPSRVILRNVTWTNTRNLIMYNAEIYDSLFANITTSGTGVLWLATANSNDMIIIMNSKFINITNTGNSGAVAYVQGDFVSINNTYASNKATNANYGALYVSADYAVSINDTFMDNSAADDYGAVFFVGKTQDAFIAIYNAKFINNTAGANGGALGTNGAILVNCTFENNAAGKNGGAIYTLTHSTSYFYFDNLTLTDVTFKDNAAGVNGQDIFITPPTSASQLSANLAGMTVSFNDLTTQTLQDFVSANVTHTSGAIIGGGKITFYLNGSYMGVAEVVDGVATLDYLGFKNNGTYVLSGEYNLATNDTVYNNATVIVALAPLKDNVTLYVSDSKGNDTTGDGSLENPYKTIKTALNSGYKQSAVIVIRVLEGSYSGELNNNLTVASTLEISIVGDGQNKTIIDGQDVSWFLNVLAGDGMVKVANMTVANVTKNYVDAKLYNQHPAITIENGAIVLLDNVGFIRCHGTEGGAIYTEGTLTVINSYFFNNGDSNNGAAIKNTGTLYIYNSKFIANHAKYYSTLYNDGNMYLVNSIIEDSMRVNGWTGNAMVMGGKGNITMINSTISRSGKTCAELIGPGQTWANNPGFAISIGSTGNVKVIDSVIDGHDKAYTAQYISNVAFGGTGSIGVFVPYGLEVVNTKILNLKDLISGSKGTNLFDKCYIENVTYATEGTSYDFNLTVVNSYFADGTTMVTKRATANVVLDNNWWGTNDQPTYKVSNVATSPDTWLILTLESSDEPGLLQDVTLAFKVTDGENVTDYGGTLYAREFNMTAVNGTLDVIEGIIDNKIVSNFKGIDEAPYYIEATVDGQTVNMTNEKLELGQSEILAEDVELMVGENKFNVTVLVNNVSTSKFNINLTVNKKTYTVPVIDGVATFEIEELPYGNYTLDYVIEDNDVCYGTSTSANLTVLRFDPVISFVSNATDEVIIILTGNSGIPFDNVTVSYSVDGVPFEGTTDENGQIIINGLKGTVEIIATYEGNAIYNPITVDENVTVFNGRKDTKINIISIDGDLNIVGVLLDKDYNQIANATIEYTFGEVTGNVTTSELGMFSIVADNGVVMFKYYETLIYSATSTGIFLKDIAPVREVTETAIALGDIEIGEDVTVDITVSNVTGELMLYVDNETVTVPVIDGKANYTITAVSAGDHNIVAVYSGDLYHEASSASQSFSAYKKVSGINLNITEVEYGENVTVTVVVEGATGEITILPDVGLAQSADLDENSTATFILENYEPGSHYVLVQYSGSEIYYEDMVLRDFEVLKKTTPIVVKAPEQVMVGHNATISVDLDESASGIVLLTIGDKNIGISLNMGNSVTIVFNEEGVYNISAMYLGDDYFDVNASETSTIEVVGKHASGIIIDVPEDIKAGSNVNVTITIANATGSAVVFTDGFENYLDLEDGVITYEIPSIQAGEHSIIVIYPGDENNTDAMNSKAFFADKEMVLANVTIPDDVKAGENVTIDVSIPGATGNVSVIVDGEVTFVPLDENGTASYTIPEVAPGDHGVVIVYPGDDTHQGFFGASNLTVSGPIASEFTDIVIGDDMNITFVLKDVNGKAIGNATVTYVVNGTANTTTTAADGSFVIPAANGMAIDVIYAGSETVLGTNTTITLNVPEIPVVVKVASHFDIENRAITINGYAVDTDADEEGMYYATTLLDANGNPISNVSIEFAVNNKIYNRTTYENGSFAPYKLNMVRAGRYTMAFNFAGDDNYTNAFACVCVDLDKKPITIKASSKTYKVSAKTKKYTVKLSTIVGSSHDGKVHMKSGMKVTLTVNGKTYTGKTNSKGQVTFKITNLSKKGKYSAKIYYKGDKTYEEAEKSVSLTVK